jgi:glyoxylase-like metal-dependent hydrolase (beta-lactamase superfamily II)
MHHPSIPHRALRGAVAVAFAWGAAMTPAPLRAAEEFEVSRVPMALVEVTPNVFYVMGQAGVVSKENEGFNSNAGFVITPEGVVVFDTLGSPALGHRLAGLIRQKTPLPVKRVVISHYHADHIYGLQAFKAPGVDVWAQAGAREYLATDAPKARLAERRDSLKPWVNEKTRIVVPDHLVKDDETFRLGGRTFRLIKAGPAHTAEDMMMMVEEEGVLFVGDLMFAGRIPFVADADTALWIRAIDRVISLKPRIVVGGHGVESRNAMADLALTRDYLKFLRAKMSEAFDDGLDFEAAYKQVDWSAWAKLPAFDAANRRNAYQTYLNIEQEALKAARDKKQ